MVWAFNIAGAPFQKMNPSTIPYEDEGREESAPYSHTWPDWAIAKVNALIRKGVPSDAAIHAVEAELENKA